MQDQKEIESRLKEYRQKQLNCHPEGHLFYVWAEDILLWVLGRDKK